MAFIVLLGFWYSGSHLSSLAGLQLLCSSPSPALGIATGLVDITNIFYVYPEEAPGRPFIENKLWGTKKGPSSYILSSPEALRLKGKLHCSQVSWGQSALVQCWAHPANMQAQCRLQDPHYDLSMWHCFSSCLRRRN